MSGDHLGKELLVALVVVEPLLLQPSGMRGSLGWHCTVCTRVVKSDLEGRHQTPVLQTLVLQTLVGGLLVLVVPRGGRRRRSLTCV